LTHHYSEAIGGVVVVNDFCKLSIL